ncbi:DUF58 domain-containing protein [Rhizomonospora bruguierae]|uniref:DUF58 domain-containing protein n=1 Tax=Rhizomonospora bruguierae TaxID=1581705 RepID=UPI001BD0C503|nr:DUF58 domain-containing protein [Micromonospora sp. NBRC 107566]
MKVTSRGIGLLVAGVAGLVTGYAFGYAELAVLGCAAIVAVLCALAYTGWRPSLSVSRLADPDRVGRGESSTVTLTVHNTSRFRAATMIAEDRCGRATVPVPLLRLRPKRDTVVNYPVPTSRRGVVPIGPLRVSRRDPLGLVTMARSQGGTAQVWVHPRIHQLSAVPAGATRSLDGLVDKVPHGSITFDSLRPYVVGDELRHVHWRTSARVGELMVREHVDTSLPSIVVLLDDRAAAYPRPADGVVETFESACEAAASVVAAAVREDLPITLHLVSGAAAGGTGGRAQATAGFLDLLAEADLTPPGQPAQTPAESLRVATDRLRHQRVGDTVVFLTGPLGRDDLGTVGALRPAYSSVVVGVFGADGSTPGGAGVVVIDAADGAQFAAEWDGVRAW